MDADGNKLVKQKQAMQTSTHNIIFPVKQTYIYIYARR